MNKLNNTMKNNKLEQIDYKRIINHLGEVMSSLEKANQSIKDLKHSLELMLRQEAGQLEIGGEEYEWLYNRITNTTN